MKVFVVNAFTNENFGGNPAAIVPLQQWIPAEQMQSIAAQHNIAETAFIVPDGKDFYIRWFTPTVEVDLCGHATLASAHVYFNHLSYAGEAICFNSKSGPLYVTRNENGKITLDFPVNKPQPTKAMEAIEKGIHRKAVETYISTFDYLAIVENQQVLEELVPDLQAISRLPARGLIVSARGDASDFVSRCFFPQSGIDEDPVTGSAHTVLIPYWAEVLSKLQLSAIQLSKRRGYLDCELKGERVLMSGNSVTYLEGENSL